MRIPVTPTIMIDQFSGGVITVPDSLTTNGVFRKKPNGNMIVTQRPGINIYEDASDVVAKVKGRGIYYWSLVGASYFVNDDTVYKGSYSAPVTNTLTSGTERVYFFEVSTYLVIIDVENNRGWYITSGASTTLTEITDVDFPPKQTPALTLAKGGCVLNGVLYVSCTNGQLYGSDSENPTSWNILNFLTAEAKPDNGVMAFEHNNHVAVLGTRTCEFFYDNANATGSPLSPRLDIVHSIGTVNYNTLWTDGQTAFFVSLNNSGDCNVVSMNNFAIQPVSNEQIDVLLTDAIVNQNIKIFGSGFTSGGHAYYCLTLYSLVSVVTPVQSLVYDATAGIWGGWELMHTGITKCPLIDFTSSTATRAGNGILTNGDIVSVVDGTVVDATEGSLYVTAGYVLDGYVVTTSGDGVNISMEIITGQTDLGIRRKKTADNLRVICNKLSTSNTITVQHSDGDNQSYNAGRTIDLSNQNNKITRLGSFITRNHKLTYAGDERVEIEGIDLDAS